MGGICCKKEIEQSKGPSDNVQNSKSQTYDKHGQKQINVIKKKRDVGYKELLAQK
tara:strand:- start:366 stop:530 length:165 start_codon:yes stop_codon:yes gene_type:complete